jgi:hypothetical protein
MAVLAVQTAAVSAAARPTRRTSASAMPDEIDLLGSRGSPGIGRRSLSFTEGEPLRPVGSLRAILVSSGAAPTRARGSKMGGGG